MQMLFDFSLRADISAALDKLRVVHFNSTIISVLVVPF